MKIRSGLLWLALVISETCSQLYLKMGAVESSQSHILSHGIVIGYVCLIVSFVLWMQILKTTKLSLALSATSLVYVTVALAAHIFLREAMPPILIFGCVMIGAGVFVLGAEKGT